MVYNPVGIEQFKTKLKSGQYTTLSNAKRAIGKAALSAQEKASCLRLAEKHDFGATPVQPARKPATAGKKKVARAKPPKPAAKAKAPVGKKKAVRKTMKRRPATTRKPEEPQPDGRAKLEEQGARIGYLAASIEAMKKAKDINPDIDVGPGPQAACDALGAIINQMHADIRELEPQQPADQAVVDRLNRTAPIGQPQEPAAPPPAPPGFEPGVS